MKRMYRSTLLLASGVLILASCASKPELRTVEETRFAAKVSAGEDVIVRTGAVAIEDLGSLIDSDDAVPRVRVQSCFAGELEFREFELTQKVAHPVITTTNKIPQWDKAAPFRGIHLRRVRISNLGEHMLDLSDIRASLIDPKGLQITMATDDQLAEFIETQRECETSAKLVEVAREQNLLSNPDLTLAAASEQVYMLPFPGLQFSAPGDWVLELRSVPSDVNNRGLVVETVSMRFTVEVKQYKAIIEQRKDGWLTGWEEVSRKAVLVE